MIAEKGTPCIGCADVLKNFMADFPSVKFDTKALSKEVNADVSVKVCDNRYSVKFHCCPLYEVCEFEKSHGMIVPIPDGYFNI